MRIIKRIAVITLTYNASIFYSSQIKSLFGDLISINTYNGMDGSVKNIDKADVYIVSTDAFESLSDYEKYMPVNVPKVEISVNFTKIHVLILWT